MIGKVFVVLLLTAAAMAQQPTPQPGPRMERGQRMKHEMMMRHDGIGPMMMPGGKWWTNSDLVQKIGITDNQVQQMEKIFQDSRLALIDQVAGVQKQEAMLEPLVEADSPDETQVLAQIDKVAQARAELEKTHARMLLSIRQVLSQEQWKKLKSEMPRPGMRSMRIGGGVQGMRMRQPRSPNAPPQAPPPDQPE